MKVVFNTIGVCLLLAFLSGNASADLVFAEDFSDDLDGPLAGGIGGVAGWEAQNDWTVDGGMAVNSGSWQRARFAGENPFGSAAFNASVGQSIQINAEIAFIGSGDGGNNLASIGFSNSTETTGQEAPQVKAFIGWNGSNLSIGGATDTSYSSGDLISLGLTFTRLAGSGFSLDTVLTNNTTGLSFLGNTIGNDVAGVNFTNPVTAWDNFELGGDAFFSIRNLDNNTGATFAVSSVSLSVVPEPSSAVLFGSLMLGLVVRRRS